MKISIKGTIIYWIELKTFVIKVEITHYESFINLMQRFQSRLQRMDYNASAR